MNKTNKVSGIILCVSLLAFIFFALYILYINQEVFYTAHDRSEYLFGAPFFHALMQKPFGLMQYVGAWLTQLFYYPLLGAGVLAVIWALIRGYWFSQSVGYLVMLLLLWAARQTPRKWHIVWYLLGVCLYPLLGWFALLFVLCLVVTEKITWREGVGVVLLVFAASIWYTQFYSYLKFDDVVLAGLPRFITPSDKTEHLSTPFWVLGAVTVIIPLCSKYAAKWFVPVLCAVAGIIFTCSLMFHDQNYIDEMRMVRYAESDNWKEVLNMAEEMEKPTTTMVFLKNVALMNEGGLLDRSFKLGNNCNPIYNPDSVHVSFLDIASPLVYYNYGMINEGIRLNFENAIQAGFSPFYLKVLSRCALAGGDKELVERYTTQLHHHLFYDDWQPAPVTDKIKALQKAYPDELTGVENSDSYIINSISLWNETDSKVASEQALLYAMLRCDSRRFWASLRNYVKSHMDDEFPQHAQEAYIMYMDKAPEEKRIILPITQAVYDGYTKFWEILENKARSGEGLEKVGEEMQEEWGDTYWWYNIFGRKVFIVHRNVGHEVQS